MRHVQVYDGEWFRVPWRRYRNQCRGCGLVHDIDFRRKPDGSLETRVSVNARSTAAVRRAFKPKKSKR